MNNKRKRRINVLLDAAVTVTDARDVEYCTCLAIGDHGHGNMSDKEYSTLLNDYRDVYWDAMCHSNTWWNAAPTEQRQLQRSLALLFAAEMEATGDLAVGPDPSLY